MSAWAPVFSNPFGMIVAGALIFGVVAIVESLAKNLRKYHEARLDASLKAQMIDRGLSVDEIERILLASSTKSVATSDKAPHQCTTC